MLYELAVADAFAIPFEFVKNRSQYGLVNDLRTYQQHPEYAGLKPSQYTDDTQRSIANAMVVLNQCTHDPFAFIRSMQNEFKADPRDGYSRRFQKFMEENQHAYPLDWLKTITHRRESNGSIMGAAPLGYLPTEVEVRFAATLQAITTHSVVTATYAQAIALTAHFFLYDLAPKDCLMSYLRDELEGWDTCFADFCTGDHLPEKSVTMKARDTCIAVLQLLDRHDSLTAMLKRAVDIGGDTDSVAALAVGLGSCCGEIENDLPEELLAGLEFGDPVKQARLRDLDARLELFRSNQFIGVDVSDSVSEASGL